ncbi:hypothetical protein [Mycolicibacterium celeriflavum]|uniref:hypothetical protein n=1 Tax=Mycolicibacterium celeriflavum TaxID=1249101 RepID=UPI003CE941B5
MTAGVALVGAGVIAAGPVAPAPANYADKSRSYEVALTAATGQSGIQDQVEATRALLEDLASGGLLEDFIKGTLAAYNLPGSTAVHQYKPVTGLESFGRIGQGFAASGLRLGATALAPLRLIELAQAISDGKGAEGFEAFVTNIVDAPLWVIDPALFSLRDALPAPLGGPDGLVMAIRHQLYLLTDEINKGLKDPGAFVESFVEGTIDAFERKGPVEYEKVDGPIDAFSRVTEGTIASALRLAAATVLGPVGVVQVAAAVAQGDTAGALKAVENIVDGPLWVADPVLYGLRDALPAPLGGPKNLVENFRNGLWSATERINGAIADAVGSATPAPEATNEKKTLLAGDDDPVAATFANPNTQDELKEEKSDPEVKLTSEQPKNTVQEKRPLRNLLPKNLLPKNLLPKNEPSTRNVLRSSLDFSRGIRIGTRAPAQSGNNVTGNVEGSGTTAAGAPDANATSTDDGNGQGSGGTTNSTTD